MAGDIDHVVDAAGDPVIAVGVAAAPVAGEIFALVGREIGVGEALVVAIDGARHCRPRIEDHEIARDRPFQQIALAVDHGRLDAEKGQRRRARLELGGARQRRDEDASGLGLPPSVDDGATLLADHAVIPLPGFRIDRLAHAAEQPKRLPAERVTKSSPAPISALIAVGAV